MGTRRRSRYGMNLVGVLITASIMALVAMGFMRFMGNATRAQSNLAKRGEASALDAGVRMLLQNSKACVETVKGLNLAQVTAAPPASPVYQPIVIRDPLGTAMFEKGKTSSGVLIDELQAEVYPPDRGVHAVRILSRFKKLGDKEGMGGKQSYEHSYWVNVTVDTAGAVDRCFEKESQGEYQITAIEPVYVNAGAGDPRVLAIMCNGAGTFPASWGRQEILPGCASCGGIACRRGGEYKTITAKGNLLSFQLQASISAFAKPPSTGAAGAEQHVSIGSIVTVHIWGTGLDTRLLVGTVSRGSDETGFASVTGMTPAEPLEVTNGATYTLQLEVQAVNGGYDDVGALPRIVATGSPARGIVIHYLRSGT